ncbi:GTP cyclohydrolase I FolE [Buchananella felis]|uniref:GTP cyclohydrolase I FolE n=1 Tax=Buchananella felis TaxID=3231492 RepID=UPI003B589538
MTRRQLRQAAQEAAQSQVTGPGQSTSRAAGEGGEKKQRGARAAEARATEHAQQAAQSTGRKARRAKHSGQYDAAAVERAIRDLLVAVGEDPDREGLRDTPARMARAYRELFGGLEQDPARHLEAVFDIGHEELVIVRDIPFYSTCEHHLLPFHGQAHVGYIPGPDGRVTGLSKLARVVEGFARRPQVQERITSQVADALVERLGAQGVIVVLEAEHMCMSMRGVAKPGARTITSAVRGQLRNAATRAEAMSLIQGGRA